MGHADAPTVRTVGAGVDGGGAGRGSVGYGVMGAGVCPATGREERAARVRAAVSAAARGRRGRRRRREGRAADDGSDIAASLPCVCLRRPRGDADRSAMFAARFCGDASSSPSPAGHQCRGVSRGLACAVCGAQLSVAIVVSTPDEQSRHVNGSMARRAGGRQAPNIGVMKSQYSNSCWIGLADLA